MNSVQATVRDNLLMGLTICPVCKVNWEALNEDLHQPLKSEACQRALVIVFNCPACKLRFRDNLL